MKQVKLTSRDARRKLAVSGKPYYVAVDPTVHLGYRRGSTKSVWVMRVYRDGGYVVTTIGKTDDNAPADGVEVLDYWQAQARARELAATVSGDTSASTGPSGPVAKRGPLTVGTILDQYAAWSRTHHKSKTAEHAIDAFIRPAFGNMPVASLTTEAIEAWRDQLVAQPPRRRIKTGATRVGLNDSIEPKSMTPDQIRARKATVNRIFVVLRAALNHAFKRGVVRDDRAWRRVDPFHNVDQPRSRFLSADESARLINACDPALRKLVRAALETGCRFGELARLVVADVNIDLGTVAIRQSKSGHGRHIFLTDAARKFFGQLGTGKASGDVLLTTAAGAAWKPNNYAEGFKAACTAARLDGVTLHTTRHTWASLALEAGMPLLVVARNLGHRDTKMVERVYGHLADKYLAKTTRQHAPVYDVADMPDEANVVAIR